MDAKKRIKEQLVEYRNAPPEMLSSTIVNLTNWQEIMIRLQNTGIPVVAQEVDINDFEQWKENYSELTEYYKTTLALENYIEKLLEHYLTYTYLNVKECDVFIDIAAHSSPWSNILNRHETITAYKQDLSYDEGLNGNMIGGNANKLPLDGGTVDSMALHCAFECFEGDSDIGFIKEAGRVLKNGGQIGIIPLYTAVIHMVSTGPNCDKKYIEVEKEARWVWRDDKWGNTPFSRHYSPEVFRKRIYDNLQGLQGEIIHFTNINELRAYYNHNIFCSLMFRATKVNGGMEQSGDESLIQANQRKGTECDNSDYREYAFDTNLIRDRFSEVAVKVSNNFRGIKRSPSIILHGVLPRSGTVYTGELIQQHLDIEAHPNEMWEIPYLKISGHILNAQEEFFDAYPLNRDRMGEDDFLPVFGEAFMAYLHSFIPEDKIMLFKVPNVQFINLFFSTFPHERLIMLLRDGRDVVNSFMKSWADTKFEVACEQWNGSTNMILDFQKRFAHKSEQFFVTKYEYAVEEPAAFIKNFCAHFQIDVDRYPFDNINQIKVHGSSSVKLSDNLTWDPLDKPDDFKPIGKWEGWSEHQKNVFKKIAGEALVKAGYAEDNNW